MPEFELGVDILGLMADHLKHVLAKSLYSGSNLTTEVSQIRTYLISNIKDINPQPGHHR